MREARDSIRGGEERLRVARIADRLVVQPLLHLTFPECPARAGVRDQRGRAAFPEQPLGQGPGGILLLIPEGLGDHRGDEVERRLVAEHRARFGREGVFEGRPEARALGGHAPWIRHRIHLRRLDQQRAGLRWQLADRPPGRAAARGDRREQGDSGQRAGALPEDLDGLLSFTGKTCFFDVSVAARHLRHRSILSWSVSVQPRPRALSCSNRVEVEAYLASEYGLPFSPAIGGNRDRDAHLSGRRASPTLKRNGGAVW